MKKLLMPSGHIVVLEVRLMIKSYSELIKMNSFDERFEYLKLTGSIGVDTFGFDRIFNQRFYRSVEWRRIRDNVILRDNGCDMGLDGYTIYGKIIVHHMNPITLEDIERITDALIDPEYLICVSHETHNAIHYGDVNSIVRMPEERRENDTCPWRK